MILYGCLGNFTVQLKNGSPDLFSLGTQSRTYTFEFQFINPIFRSQNNAIPTLCIFLTYIQSYNIKYDTLENKT